jgi:hypothetical protein
MQPHGIPAGIIGVASLHRGGGGIVSPPCHPGDDSDAGSSADHWKAAREHARTGAGPFHPGDLSPRAQDDWADLVRSRLGASAIVAAPSRFSGGVAPRQFAHRPSVWFGHGEHAMLHAMRDDHGSAESLACAIARRLVWHSHGGVDQEHRRGAGLFWRNHAWTVRAIDAWERRAPPWWSLGSGWQAGRDAAIGSVYSRLQIEPGLWLFVRWPLRLPVIEDPPSMVGTGMVSTGVAGSVEHILMRMSRSVTGSGDGRSGVELVVLGAWM